MRWWSVTEMAPSTRPGSLQKTPRSPRCGDAKAGRSRASLSGSKPLAPCMLARLRRTGRSLRTVKPRGCRHASLTRTTPRSLAHPSARSLRARNWVPWLCPFYGLTTLATGATHRSSRSDAIGRRRDVVPAFSPCSSARRRGLRSLRSPSISVRGRPLRARSSIWRPRAHGRAIQLRTGLVTPGDAAAAARCCGGLRRNASVDRDPRVGAAWSVAPSERPGAPFWRVNALRAYWSAYRVRVPGLHQPRRSAAVDRRTAE